VNRQIQPPPARDGFSRIGPRGVVCFSADVRKARSPSLNFILLPVLLALAGGVAPAQTPTVSGFTPALGLPGTQVIISGANFGAATKVQFGTALADFAVVTANQINATVPNGATLGKITVTSAVGGLSSAADFLPPPAITNIVPVRGVVGTLIVIDGANFVSGATAVYFNGTPATVGAVTAPTQIAVVVPAGATTGPIVIVNLAGAVTNAAPFTISAAPVVTDFTPLIGPAGTEVLINGANFIAGATTVRFNGVASGSVVVTANTQLRTIVPAGTTNGLLSIVTASGTGTSVTNFLTGPQPLITDYFNSATEFTTPSRVGAPGSSVTLVGFNFLGTTSVRFNGVAATAITSITANRVQAIVPAGATTGLITVTTASGTGTTPADFITGTAPFISDFSPPLAAPGAIVTLNGINFTGTSAVRFNGVGAGFSVTAVTQIQATVPAGATAGLISVTTAAGSHTNSTSFTVTGSGPFITSFTPTNGPRGTSVVLSGANFSGVTTVRFGGVASTNFFASAQSQITAEVPPGALTGPVSVTTTPGSHTNATTFFVPPQLASITPFGTNVAGSVTIVGANFTGTTAVEFNGTAAAFTVNSNSQLTATVPTNATTGQLRLVAPAGVFLTPGTFAVTPRLDSFTPTLGPAGTSVSLRGHTFTGATAVRFNGVNASFAVNSATNITVTVPGGASTGPITVVTASGSGVSATNFTITTATDLVLTYTNSPAIVQLGQNIQFNITVSNAGPSIATGVVFTDTLPAGVGFVSAFTSQGSHSFANSVFTANLGVITNGAAATITLLVLPPTDGLVNNQMNLSLAEGDPNTFNNFNSAVIPVITAAQRTLAFQLVSAQQFQASWPFSVVDFVLQGATNLASSNIAWVDITAGVNQVTNASVVTRQFLDDATQPRRFYRLRSP